MGKSRKKSKHSNKKNSSSSSDEWVEVELVKKSKRYKSKERHYYSSEESSVEETINNRKSRQNKYEKSFSSSSDGSGRQQWKETLKRRYSSANESSEEPTSKTNSSKSHKKQSNETRQVLDKREDWMNLSTSFSSFSNEERKKQREQNRKQQKETEQDNSSKCPRELNPYWKDGGDGLPKFHKPKVDSDDDSYRHKYERNPYKKPQSNWRKSQPDTLLFSSKNDKFNTTKSNFIATTGSRMDQTNTERKYEKCNFNIDTDEKSITEKELNLLAGKLIKAEIMGNENLVRELKERLENGKKALAVIKLKEEPVLLTQTDRHGRSKPLILQDHYEQSSSNKKQRKKAVDTHKDKQRVRYFPDDDKYSLKQMFENAKLTSANDQDSEFMKIASKIRKNDDLDDLFADNVRRKKSYTKIDEANHSKAVIEHKKIAQSLDNCPKCIQSNAMQNHLIVSMGEYVYLSVPAHEPLLEGHCLIVPIRHVTSITLLDENEWYEIKQFRKALVNLYASKNKEAIFFEIATGFHRYPHTILECVPLPKEEGEMAPIYFKKAIDESETEWAQNKKLVSLKDRDVRRAIPKGLCYFVVSFGMDEGFAHVIEDEKLFPKNFAQEIIGGMLDLHHSKWRKPSRQSFDVQSKRVLEFSNQWKEFDCTVDA